jgi:hypothetical protein
MADEPAKIVLGDTAIAALERRPRKRSELSHCENCGAQLHGHWCSQCGQAAVDYRRSFRHVIVDVLDSFLNWDSKFFATLALLIVKPWRLTNDFLAGQRVHYVHPLRLYLLASILFFFAVNYWAKSIHLQPGKVSLKDRAELEAELKKEDLPPEVRARIESAIRLNSPPPLPEASDLSPVPSVAASAQPKEEVTKDQSQPLLAQFGPANSSTPSTPFEQWVETRAKEKIGEKGTKLELFLATLFNNLPYMMLCCIPLFAIVLKILYIRRHIFYIDHLVYALHVHTFAYVGIMLIVFATIGLNRLAPSTTGWITLLWLAFAAQIFLSVLRVYRQGWLISTLKFLLGGFAYLIVLSVALAVTLFVTLAMP